MGRASAAANGERPGGSSNTNNGAETGRELALTTTTPSGDILSADPSTLDVRRGVAIGVRCCIAETVMTVM